MDATKPRVSFVGKRAALASPETTRLLHDTSCLPRSIWRMPETVPERAHGHVYPRKGQWLLAYSEPRRSATTGFIHRGT